MGTRRSAARKTQSSPPHGGQKDRAARGGSCLLLHGIAAGPSQFDAFVERLERRGIEWRAPLLPGHGTRHEDLRGVKWSDWYGAAEKCFDELEREHGRVSIVGFSLGSLLAIEIARRRKAARMALLNTPIFSFYRFLPQKFLLKVLNILTAEIRTFGGGDGKMRIYRRVPVSTLNAMAELIDRAKKSLPYIKCPCLIIHSRFDLASRARSAKYIYRHLGSEEKSIVWVRSRDHSILEGAARKTVIERLDAFVSGRAGAR